MSDQERIGDLKHTLEQVLGSYKKANERIAELEALVKRMDEDNKCFEDICADATALIGYERDDAHALTTFLTQYISDKDKRIAAMAELLEFLTHDIVAWKTNTIGVITGQRCATDCPACAWEKLKGQM